MKKDVTLVLSGGGARGIAHIAVIRELERRGYRIVSLCGSSIGSLVGFAYATDRLPALEKFFLSLNCNEMANLLDFSFSDRGLLKGNRIFSRLLKAVPNRPLESLPLPLVIVSSDLSSGRERVFTRGSAYRAIRASTAIPGILAARNEDDNHILVDGGVLNPLPLSRAVRLRGSLLVAVNLYAPAPPDFEPVHGEPVHRILENKGLLDRIQRKWRGLKAWRGGILDYLLESSESTESLPGLLKRAAALMMVRIAEQSIAQEHPDVVVSVPYSAAGPLDFHKSRQLQQLGARLATEALDRFEAEHGWRHRLHALWKRGEKAQNEAADS